MKRIEIRADRMKLLPGLLYRIGLVSLITYWTVVPPSFVMPENRDFMKIATIIAVPYFLYNIFRDILMFLRNKPVLVFTQSIVVIKSPKNKESLELSEIRSIYVKTNEKGQYFLYINTDSKQISQVIDHLEMEPYKIKEIVINLYGGKSQNWNDLN